MAYVALSRVRSLSGIYLTAFNPQSIMVSTKCVKEVNRLRQTFRKDLPLYDIPLKSASTAKRKLTGITDDDLPNAKKSKLDAASTKSMKRETSVHKQHKQRENVVVVILHRHKYMKTH